MASAAWYESFEPGPSTGGDSGRGFPIITDTGSTARVVLVELAGPPRLGDRFERDGRTWVIVRLPDRVRGAVAVPFPYLLS